MKWVDSPVRWWNSEAPPEFVSSPQVFPTTRADALNACGRPAVDLL